jgi:hypothetical protein
MNKKKTISAMIAAGIVVAAILVLGPIVTVKKVNGWTCALTGSQKGNITWFGCFTVSDWYRQSPIEEWLAHSNHQIEHNWVRTVGTSYSIFGGRGRAHSRAPAVYYFPAELQERFLSTASAEEVETFLELIRSGDQDKIREAVDQLNKKIMKDM